MASDKESCVIISLLLMWVTSLVLCHSDRVAYKIKDEFTIFAENLKLSDVAVHSSSLLENLQQCKKACEQRQDFHCEAASYCSKSLTCYLSSYLVTSANITVYEEGCLLLSRNYTSVYDEHQYIVVSSDSEFEEKDVTDSETCAQRCLAASWCKGFEFCSGNPICTLHKKHINELPKDAIQKTLAEKETCSFYDRNHLLEFKRDPGKILYGAHYRMVGLTSEMDCAEICANDSYSKCLAFDYCGWTNNSMALCMLSKEDETTNSHVKFIDHPACDHFSRKFEPWKLEDLDHAFNVRRRYSTGAVAGVGLGFLLVGLILGFLASLGYSKFQCKFKPVGEVTERYQAGFRFVKFENREGTSNSNDDAFRYQ